MIFLTEVAGARLEFPACVALMIDDPRFFIEAVLPEIDKTAGILLVYVTGNPEEDVASRLITPFVEKLTGEAGAKVMV
jgi:hypothetical protein